VPIYELLVNGDYLNYFYVCIIPSLDIHQILHE